MAQLLTILQKAGEFLHEKGSPSARLDAEVLLANVLGMQRIELYANYDRPLDKSELDRFRQLVARRGKLEPVAYITGYKEFYSREFEVNENVLIPRPETELLVEKVISYLKVYPREKPEILELCTGSGAVAVTLALEIDGAVVTANDISKEALAVAKRNAACHQVSLDFNQGDLFSDLNKKFDLIVANPPYIATHDIEHLQESVRLFEPKLALDGGKDGLDYYRKILTEAYRYLQASGAIFLEIGQNQATEVAAIAQKVGVYTPAMVAKDLAGKNRAIFLKKVNP